MNYSIIEVDIGSSRQKVLVRAHVPVFYPNLYVTREMRKRSPNTQHTLLSHLIVLLEFLMAEGIDLESRLNQRPTSNYLDDAELSRFVQHANWKKRVLDKKHAGMGLLPSAHGEVGGVHAEARCEAASDYLAFLYEQLGDHTKSNSAVKWLKARMRRKIVAARPSWRKSNLEEIKGLTNVQRDLLYEKFFPTHPDNPFKKEAQRHRNYIMILLGIELGLRRSEMLLVKLADIDYAQQKIDVVRPIKNTDHRRHAPRLKTNERRLPASDLLMSIIERYRREYRIVDRAQKNPFLLVAHGRNEGAPLSIKAVDTIFESMTRKFPELLGVTPHVLRHDSVYTLLSSMSTELHQLSVEDRTQRIQKVLTYAFGWSPNSEMPSLYGAKFWREQADSFFAKREEHFTRSKSVSDNIKNIPRR